MGYVGSPTGVPHSCPGNGGQNIPFQECPAICKSVKRGVGRHKYTIYATSELYKFCGVLLKLLPPILHLPLFVKSTNALTNSRPSARPIMAFLQVFIICTYTNHECIYYSSPSTAPKYTWTYKLCLVQWDTRTLLSATS